MLAYLACWASGVMALAIGLSATGVAALGAWQLSRLRPRRWISVVALGALGATIFGSLWLPIWGGHAGAFSDAGSRISHHHHHILDAGHVH